MNHHVSVPDLGTSFCQSVCMGKPSYMSCIYRLILTFHSFHLRDFKKVTTLLPLQWDLRVHQMSRDYWRADCGFHLQYLLRILKDPGKQVIRKSYPSPGIEFNWNSGSLCLFQVETVRPQQPRDCRLWYIYEALQWIHLDSLIFIYYHVLINSVFDT